MHLKCSCLRQKQGAPLSRDKIEQTAVASDDDVKNSSRVNAHTSERPKRIRKRTTSALVDKVKSSTKTIFNYHKEREKIGEKDRTTLERTYSKIAAYSSEPDVVTKTSLRQAFDDIVGKAFNESLFDKLFAVFDADSDGKVNVDEFVVAMAFLLNLNSDQDDIEVAFTLFDSDLDGIVSRDEFNKMINAIFVNRLSYVLNTEEGRKLFSQHLESEWSSENIQFYDAVLQKCKKYGTKTELSHLKRSNSGMEHDTKGPETLSQTLDWGEDSSMTNGFSSRMPKNEAEELYDLYISKNAANQINICAETTTEISRALNESSNNEVPLAPFLQAAIEVHDLMESDSFQRFKQKMADAPHEHLDYAEEVWKKLEISSDKGLSLKDFRLWANENKGYFKFLEDIQKQLNNFKASYEGPSAESVPNKQLKVELNDETASVQQQVMSLRKLRYSFTVSKSVDIYRSPSNCSTILGSHSEDIVEVEEDGDESAQVVSS